MGTTSEWKKRIRENDPERYDQIMEKDRLRKRRAYRNNVNGYRDKQLRQNRMRYQEKNPQAKHYKGYEAEEERLRLEDCAVETVVSGDL